MRKTFLLPVRENKAYLQITLCAAILGISAFSADAQPWQNATTNPFSGVDVGDDAHIALVDLDNDGDLDLAAGSKCNNFYYYKNTGTATNPVYVHQTGSSNPFNGLCRGNSSVDFIDWDNDGDLDMVSGDSNGRLYYYKNIGSQTSPNFCAAPTPNAFSNLGDLGSYSNAEFADWNGDGFKDLFVVLSNGTIKYFRNNGNNSGFTQKTGTDNPFNAGYDGCYGSIAFTDVDGDGDLDAVVGNQSGSGSGKNYLVYFERTGTNTVVKRNTATNNPFYNIQPGACTGDADPDFADIDNDGDMDLIVGAGNGKVYLYKNESIKLTAKAFLRGAFNGTRHKDVTTAWVNVLKAKALSQPYNTAAFGNYAGTESVTAAAFTATAADNDVLDWVLLELKKADGTLVERHAALILENGNIVSTDKVSAVSFKAQPGSYHLTIRHRNHLGLSTELINFTAGNNNFNFTTATDATLFGTAAAFTTMNGKTLLIGGNANSNLNVRYNGPANDRDAILAFLGANETGLTAGVYTAQDVNMDGTVRYNGPANDRDFLLLMLGASEVGFIQQQIK